MRIEKQAGGNPNIVILYVRQSVSVHDGEKIGANLAAASCVGRDGGS